MASPHLAFMVAVAVAAPVLALGCAAVVGADFDGLHRRCDSGLVDCDDQAATGASGCETDVQRDRDNCGACGRRCVGTCTVGECAECPKGFADCDHDFSTGENGCESELSTDAEHCGACQQACEPDADGPTVCVQSECVAACDGGYADCNDDEDDGCEAPLARDPENCGECGVVCKNAHGENECAAGKCRPTCEQGFEDCDDDPSNGCEAGLDSDTRNCGACGERCLAGGVCDAGACACPAVRPDVCGSSCVTFDSDPAHCGDCGVSCAMAPQVEATCEGGGCAYACKPGTEQCGELTVDGCADLTSDAAHCGDCEISCGRGLSCLSGECCEPIVGPGECNPFPACGCAAGSVCAPETEETGLLCVPGGNAQLGAACDNADCAVGLGCFGGACKQHCNVDADCPALDGSAQCFQTNWASTGHDIAGVKVCAVVCDPVSPQSPDFGLRACGEGLACGPDQTGASDCYPGGAVTAAGACDDDNRCAPGSYCAGDGTCVEWCFSGGDCFLGLCRTFTTPLFAGSHELGYCDWE